MERTFSYEDDAAFSRAGGNGPPQSRAIPMSGSISPTQRRTQQRTPSGGLARSSVYGNKRSSAQDSMDADAKLVMDSISASRRLERYSSTGYSDDDDSPAAALVPQSLSPSSHAAQGPSRMPENRQRSSGPVFDSSDRDFTTDRRQDSAETTPRAQKSGLAYHGDDSLFDAPTHSGRQAPVLRPKVQPPQRPQTQNKIMTPAQFEQYRREQEMTSTAHPRGKQENSDDEDDYEDDDEIERAQVAARQRKKQEAHMSVYRQQMMKMTGEQPSDLPNIQLRPGMDRSSMSAPTLQSSNVPEFSFDKPSENGKASDDEDEDVPLGVLAAHGFPSKNRPPTAAGNVGSTIQYKSESYPPPPASVTGSGAGRSSTLPAFARHLPPDPYFGAGLVNPTNRESLAFGLNQPRSVHGGSQMGSPVPGPPGGLVGVINAEERARAARRGSPNAHGQYGSPLPPGMMPPTIGIPPMMTPADQATAQMSEQMNQMMQMQMQWMQQMQAMMAGGGMMPPGQQPPFMPGMPPQQQQQMMMMQPGMLPPAPSHGQQQRPMSTGSHSAPGAPMAHPAQPRAMSMMGPGPTTSWPQNRKSVAPSMMSGALDSQIPGYAGSIAPSERSNVGMPSRYRPVSIAPADEHQAPRVNSRASTFTDGTLQPGVSGRNSRLSTSGDRSQSRLSSLRPASTSPRPPKKAASDDDDDEGWAEMKNKRDKKKSMWRMNRKSKQQEKPEFDVYDYPADA